MMTIYDFHEYVTDPSFQKVTIWDNEKEMIVFNGTLHEAAFSKLGECEIQSIDTVFDDTLTININ